MIDFGKWHRMFRKDHLKSLNTIVMLVRKQEEKDY